jgi:alpha-methylacyl-CoA racemase
MQTKTSLPLKGLKILDLTRLLPGPLCTCLLGDLGAEIIKIEDTQLGDYMRFFPPMATNNSLLFLMLNRNKKSVSLDLKKQEAIEIFKKLVNETDVLVESFRPGVMDKLGIGYETLKAINPKLVFCNINGFGNHSEYGTKAGHDLNFIGLAGITIEKDGEAVVPPFQLADVVSGAIMAALNIVSASYKALKTGEGSFINHSIVENLGSAFPFSLLDNAGLSNENIYTIVELLTGKTPFYRYYKTSDGKWVAFAPIEHKFWSNFCTAFEKYDWLVLYMKKENGLQHEIASLIGSKSWNFWKQFSLDYDCCVTPVYENMASSPLSLTFTENHPIEGEILHHKNIASEKGAVYAPAPQWGEHNVEILVKLGYSEKQIQQLADSKVIRKN